MENSPEPWLVSGDFIVNHHVEKIASGRGNRNWAKDAKRIVECVNACAGLDPRALKELVEASKAILGSAPGFDDFHRFSQAVKALTDPLPKTVEGDSFLERRKFLKRP